MLTERSESTPGPVSRPARPTARSGHAEADDGADTGEPTPPDPDPEPSEAEQFEAKLDAWVAGREADRTSVEATPADLGDRDARTAARAPAGLTASSAGGRGRRLTGLAPDAHLHFRTREAGRRRLGAGGGRWPAEAARAGAT